MAAQAAREIADWKDKFRPVEDRLIGRYLARDSEAALSREEGRAHVESMAALGSFTPEAGSEAPDAVSTTARALALGTSAGEAQAAAGVEQRKRAAEGRLNIAAIGLNQLGAVKASQRQEVDNQITEQMSRTNAALIRSQTKAQAAGALAGTVMGYTLAKAGPGQGQAGALRADAGSVQKNQIQRAQPGYPPSRQNPMFSTNPYGYGQPLSAYNGMG